MATQPLPLSILCDVSVSVSSQGVSTPSFNQGLIVGNSGVIPSQGAGSRVQEFASLATLTSAGFTPTDPEYLAASLYFSQSPAPQYLWVGCQDPSALATITIDVAGTGWAVGDKFLITQAGASYGYGTVTAETAGVPTAITIVPGSQGTAYSIGSALVTTAVAPSTGAGLEVNITSVGETPLQAITACRLAQPAWYAAMVCGAADADHLAIAEFAQTAVPQMQYLYGTQSATALAGSTGNIFSEIKAGGYSRAHGAYSTLQGGGAPNNAYIAAAVSGVAMGLNTGLANSNFTLDAKTLVGITAENLSLAQFSVPAGDPGQTTGNNGNVYLNFANTYSKYIQGINGNGTWFDQILGLDMLAADCQASVLSVLFSLPSIPLTNAGQSLSLNACNGACSRSATRGFLAGGTWTGPTVLGLTAGTSLPSGYLVQSASYATQTSAQRALRASMPIYVSVILADSQQSFTIGINVQQ